MTLQKLALLERRPASVKIGQPAQGDTVAKSHGVTPRKRSVQIEKSCNFVKCPGTSDGHPAEAGRMKVRDLFTPPSCKLGAAFVEFC